MLILDEPYVSIVKKLCNIGYSTALEDLLPNVLHNRKILSANVKVVAQKSANNTKLTMILAWSESKDENNETSCRRSSQKSCSTKSVSHASSKGAKTKKAFITCDGPCNEKRCPKEVHIMGRCDHYICDFCYKISNNPDGSIGCTAFDCMRINKYNNMDYQDAIDAYKADIVAMYKVRKALYKRGEFRIDSHIKRVSNPPSNRESRRQSLTNSKEVANNVSPLYLKPRDIHTSHNTKKIAVRMMIYHKHYGRTDCTVLVYNFLKEVDLKTVIHYALSKIGGQWINTIRASIGTSENQATFRPLDNKMIQKTLAEFAGVNGKIHIIIDTLKRIYL